MFSFEEYYKLLNSAVAPEYQEKCEKLTDYLEILKKEMVKDKGFRERKDKFLLFTGSFVRALAELEQKRREAFRQKASADELHELQKDILSYFEEENYSKSFLCPTYANEVFAGGLGFNLCALAGSFTDGLEDALAGRRYRLLKKINFFLQIAQNFDTTRISAQSVQKLLSDYKTEIVTDELSLEFFARTALDRSAYATLGVSAEETADWSDIAYIYRAASPIDDWTLDLAEKMANAEASFVEEKANSIVDAIKRASSVSDRTQNKKSAKAKRDSFDKLSLFSYTLGAERVVALTLKKVKEADLPVEYLPIVSSNFSLPSVYLADHQADSSLYLSKEYAEVYKAAWNQLEIRFAPVLGQLHSDFFLRINLPYVEKTEHTQPEGALKLTEEQELLQKELFDMKRVSLGQTLPGHYFNELTYTLVLN